MSRKQTKKSPETQFDGTVPFDAQELQRRAERLRREGRMPSLVEVLRIVRKAAEERD